MEEDLTNTQEKNHSPAMSQFYDIKDKYPDSILFFRMGDFYEMFGNDALEASKILGIALTSRNKNSANPIPLCGIPYHSYLPYLIKLLKAGKKVAICEQLEDPKFAKGVVKRGVTRVVTPGTIVEEDAFSGFDNNFLLSVYGELSSLYVAAIDVSTGETYLKSFPADKPEETVRGWQIKEIISNTDITVEGFEIQKRETSNVYKSVQGKVLQHYGATSEKALHIEDKGFIWAIAMALDYLDDLILQTKLSRPVTLSDKECLILDGVATRTLELVENSSGTTANTLFEILNKTKTPMGGRFLKNLVIRPSRNIKIINERLDIVDFFSKNIDFLSAIRGLLNGVHDIERISGRLLSGKAMPKDLVWLRNSLHNIPEIDAMLSSYEDFFKNYKLNSHKDLYDLIDKAVEDDPSPTLKDGGIIKTGYNQFVDELRVIKNNSEEILKNIEEKERKASGINQLKIGYNKIFGFFIEVSKGNLSKVPPHFERKQTLVNAERFVTDELKELENKILNADDKLTKIEYDLFIEVRKFAAEHSIFLRELSKKIAEIDCLASLAECALRNGYVRPSVDNSSAIDIKDGRHPVVETKTLSSFIPNDFRMDTKNERLILITGPNMSGKSTYLRSAALIAIMAHMGSFVPAKSARIGVLDRIFTRVGASDNLSKGESTFMVEMVETSNILSNATKNSLIILDEIGRGTSTFDGVSIAWSVAEYILNKIGAKTLFATHYHELTEIAEGGNGAKNYTVKVQEWQKEIIFLRKVVEGSADKSYGIYVGKLAGLPPEVTDRAEEVLKHLEKHEELGMKSNDCVHLEKKDRIYQPILVFDDSHPVIEQLKKLDTDNLTPMAALQLIHELKQKAAL